MKYTYINSFYILFEIFFMEVDSRCLFADVGGCTGTSTSCRYLCKTPSTIEDSSYLYGGKTKIESLLLQYGKFDILPCNVEEFYVCSGHLKSIQPSLFKNCCLCKPFGRSKCSKSGLRIVSKSYAFVAWKKMPFVFHLDDKCAHSAAIILTIL